MKICSFQNCRNKHDSHGFCANHARQYRKYGHPLTKEEISKQRSEISSRLKNNLGKTWTIAADKRHKGVRRNTGRTHFKTGMTAWNKDTKGLMVSWNKGKKLPYDVWNKGKTLDSPVWNKGKHMPTITGEKNHNWKGDDVSYRALHRWVEGRLGKSDICNHCGTSGLTGRKIHWSNVSGNYLRDITDWQRLCAKCHKAYDTGKLTLAQIGG